MPSHRDTTHGYPRSKGPTKAPKVPVVPKMPTLGVEKKTSNVESGHKKTNKDMKYEHPNLDPAQNPLEMPNYHKTYSQCNPTNKPPKILKGLTYNVYAPGKEPRFRYLQENASMIVPDTIKAHLIQRAVDEEFDKELKSSEKWLFNRKFRKTFNQVTTRDLNVRQAIRDIANSALSSGRTGDDEKYERHRKQHGGKKSKNDASQKEIQEESSSTLIGMAPHLFTQDELRSIVEYARGWSVSGDRNDMVRFLVNRIPLLAEVQFDMILCSAVDLLDRYVIISQEMNPQLIFPLLSIARKLHDSNPYINQGDTFEHMLNRYLRGPFYSPDEMAQAEINILNTLKFDLTPQPLLLEWANWFGTIGLVTQSEFSKINMLVFCLLFSPKLLWTDNLPCLGLAIVIACCGDEHDVRILRWLKQWREEFDFAVDLGGGEYEAGNTLGDQKKNDSTGLRARCNSCNNIQQSILECIDNIRYRSTGLPSIHDGDQNGGGYAGKQNGGGYDGKQDVDGRSQSEYSTNANDWSMQAEGSVEMEADVNGEHEEGQQCSEISQGEQSRRHCCEHDENTTNSENRQNPVKSTQYRTYRQVKNRQKNLQNPQKNPHYNRMLNIVGKLKNLHMDVYDELEALHDWMTHGQFRSIFHCVRAQFPEFRRLPTGELKGQLQNYKISNSSDPFGTLQTVKTKIEIFHQHHQRSGKSPLPPSVHGLREEIVEDPATIMLDAAIFRTYRLDHKKSGKTQDDFLKRWNSLCMQEGIVNRELPSPIVLGKSGKNGDPSCGKGDKHKSLKEGISSKKDSNVGNDSAVIDTTGNDSADKENVDPNSRVLGKTTNDTNGVTTPTPAGGNKAALKSAEEKDKDTEMSTADQKTSMSAAAKSSGKRSVEERSPDGEKVSPGQVLVPPKKLCYDQESTSEKQVSQFETQKWTTSKDNESNETLIKRNVTKASARNSRLSLASTACDSPELGNVGSNSSFDSNIYVNSNVSDEYVRCNLFNEHFSVDDVSAEDAGARNQNKKTDTCKQLAEMKTLCDFQVRIGGNQVRNYVRVERSSESSFPSQEHTDSSEESQRNRSEDPKNYSQNNSQNNSLGDRPVTLSSIVENYTDDLHRQGGQDKQQAFPTMNEQQGMQQAMQQAIPTMNGYIIQQNQMQSMQNSAGYLQHDHFTRTTCSGMAPSDPGFTFQNAPPLPATSSFQYSHYVTSSELARRYLNGTDSEIALTNGRSAHGYDITDLATRLFDGTQDSNGGDYQNGDYQNSNHHKGNFQNDKYHGDGQTQHSYQNAFNMHNQQLSQQHNQQHQLAARGHHGYGLTSMDAAWNSYDSVRNPYESVYSQQQFCNGMEHTASFQSMPSMQSMPSNAMEPTNSFQTVSSLSQASFSYNGPQPGYCSTNSMHSCNGMQHAASFHSASSQHQHADYGIIDGENPSPHHHVLNASRSYGVNDSQHEDREQALADLEGMVLSR